MCTKRLSVPILERRANVFGRTPTRKLDIAGAAVTPLKSRAPCLEGAATAKARQQRRGRAESVEEPTRGRRVLVDVVRFNRHADLTTVA